MSRVLVVTPYHREPALMLRRCLTSVAAQTHPVDHLLVADGHPADWIDAHPVRHLRLDRAHGDNGNTPRGLGLMLGVGEGYDAIALLDADNWFEPDHVAACLRAAAAEPCDYVVARRRLMRLDGTPLPVVDEPIEAHVDTSCFFFLPGSYAVLPRWGTMPRPLSPICDRIFYAALRNARLAQAVADRVTVNFTARIDVLYRPLGEAPPRGTKPPPDMTAIQRWIDGLDDAALRRAGHLAGVGLLRSGVRSCG